MATGPSAAARRVAWSARLFVLRLVYFRSILHTPARKVLEYDLFYHVATEVAPRNILFLGVAPYTRFYHRLFPSSRFVTLDYDPECAVFGSPHEHVVADAADLERFWPSSTFDTVMCNGIYGWSITTREGFDRLLSGIRKVLVPGGFFLFGWNSGREFDPLNLETYAEQMIGFRPVTLNGREFLKVPSERDHCFRFFLSR